MGVHSLWEILAPSSRPVRLEALSRRKLAVDASIWIYQFLKAVRDKEGHALKNSHIVGFFRRICKLLYFGIQPVFVFDGGAPALKRTTISRRKERRRDKAETLQQTAQKLLAIQLQKLADENYQKKVSPKKISSAKKEIADDELEFAQYYEDNDYLSAPAETEKKQQVPTKEKVFRKDDDYHLPDDEIKADKDDNRMITDWEFKRLTEGLDNELEGVDLDNVDPTSESFHELPIATQYMVLSHLRLRSRLRMGYTKEQLETLFPNSMDFSKFQISMVQKRNFLTQKLMHVNGMDNTEIVTTRRIAGEKGREYQLMKNSDGYTLSLAAEENSATKPILLDENGNVIKRREESSKTAQANEDEDEDDDDFDFEDVPIEAPVAASKVEMQDNFDQADIDLDALFLETESKMLDSYKNSEFYNPSADLDSEIDRAIEFHKMNDVQEKKLATDATIPPPVSTTTPKSVFQSSQGADKVSGHTSSSSGAPSFSFGHSMLSVRPANTNAEVELRSEQFEGSKNTNTVAAPVQEIADNIEEEEMSTEDAQEPKARPAPTWFGQSQVGFGEKNPYNTDYSIYNKAHEKTLDEEAGLISLEQAREYIEEDGEEEEEDEKEEELDDSDVEIVDQELENAQENAVAKSVTKPKAISDIIQNQKLEAPALDYDFSESEEDDLVEQLQQEEMEHERFKSSLNNGEHPSWSLEDEKGLQDQRRKDRRDADEVTQGMIQDVQELLSRFGIPFITAPMEAEAQCATLFELGLVDGIITDDSDCFLFGGDMIYKNMFNEKSYVECYIVEDIARDFGLTRDKMIDLALMLGSDYTEGLKGIGKVTAMEILAEFQTGDSESPLINFRDWWLEYQKGAKIDPNESKVRKNLRKNFAGKLFLDLTFPDPLVKEAYIKPEVDKDRTEFRWGTPDLDRLRTFLMYTIGWSQQKVDEVLVPVIKDINKKQQTTISEYFPREVNQTRKQLMVGKRLREATTKLTKNKRQKQ